MHRRRPRRRHVDRGGVVRSDVKREPYIRAFDLKSSGELGLHPLPAVAGRGWRAPTSAFTRVFDAMGASRVRGSVSRRANLPSPAGLTRGSILFVRTFLRTGWIAGSSPAMTTAIAARIGPSPGPRYARATLSPLAGRGHSERAA